MKAGGLEVDLPAARAEGETGEETAAAEEEEDSEAARAGGDSVAVASVAEGSVEDSGGVVKEVAKAVVD